MSADGERVCFQASVPALGENTYSFEAGAFDVRSDLLIKETSDIIELSNARTAVRLNKNLDNNAGPIAGWRLASGKWMGGSSFETGQKLAGYEVNIVERGPVFALATARVDFEDGGSWSMTVELQAGEPLFRVRESFDCENLVGRFVLNLNKDFNPSWILFRAGGQFDRAGGTTQLGQVIADRIPSKGEAMLFLLEPWLHWRYSLNRGTWFSLNPDDADVFLWAQATLHAGLILRCREKQSRRKLAGAQNKTRRY